MLICLVCLYVAVFLSLFLSLSHFSYIPSLMIDDYPLSPHMWKQLRRMLALHLDFYVCIRVCGWDTFLYGCTVSYTFVETRHLVLRRKLLNLVTQKVVCGE